MNNLEHALSDHIGVPLRVRSIGTETKITASAFPCFSFDIECDMAPVKNPKDDEIPFCDMDCSGCCACDLMDEYEVEDEDPCFWGVPDILKVIFNPPATIVFWDDGTKTVVKCMDGQPFEKYAGFAAACMKKMFGSTSRAKAIMEECDQDTWKQWLEEEKARKQNAKAKKAEPKTKVISVDDLVTAFTESIKNIVNGKTEEKESPNETPAE